MALALRPFSQALAESNSAWMSAAIASGAAM
jgi:hypothetical protein